jgi:hypothetical protein
MVYYYHMPMIAHGMDNSSLFIFPRTSFNAAFHISLPPLSGSYPPRRSGHIDRDDNQYRPCSRADDMDGSAVGSETVEQTARASAMLGVVLQYLTAGEGLQNIVKCYAILHHFLMGMLCDPNTLCLSQSTYSTQHGLCVCRVVVHH